jgi:hypothetical protein
MIFNRRKKIYQDRTIMNHQRKNKSFSIKKQFENFRRIFHIFDINLMIIWYRNDNIKALKTTRRLEKRLNQRTEKLLVLIILKISYMEKKEKVWRIKRRNKWKMIDVNEWMREKKRKISFCFSTWPISFSLPIPYYSIKFCISSSRLNSIDWIFWRNFCNIYRDRKKIINNQFNLITTHRRLYSFK